MDFSLTEEQELIRNRVREFAENEVKPIAAEIDKNHRFPTETVNRMKALDIMGLSIPEEYNGSAGGTMSKASGDRTKKLRSINPDNVPA